MVSNALPGPRLRECTAAPRGEAVQVDPVKPMLKPPGTMLLKVRSDGPLSNVAFKLNLRHYSAVLTHAAPPPPPPPLVVRDAHATAAASAYVVGRCRLTLSNPC